MREVSGRAGVVNRSAGDSVKGPGGKAVEQSVPTMPLARPVFDDLLGRRMLSPKALDRALLVLGNFFWLDDSGDAIASAWKLENRKPFRANLDLSRHNWISDRSFNDCCSVGGVELDSFTLVAFSVAPPLLRAQGIFLLPKTGGAVGARLDARGWPAPEYEGYLLDREGYCHVVSQSGDSLQRYRRAFSKLESIYSDFAHRR